MFRCDPTQMTPLGVAMTSPRCHTDVMELQLFVDELRGQLLASAENGGDESRAVAQRMSATIDAAAHLVLLEAISAAADEITLELAPGSVQVRLRGRDPEFAVTIPSEQPAQAAVPALAPVASLAQDTDDGGTARITLRLSETLKSRVEEAATNDSLSVNAWLVRAIATATDVSPPSAPSAPTSGQSYTGWVR